MLRMPVEVRAEGKSEKYAVSIPAYVCKEDLKQAVEDGMLIHNHNFVQSAKLVCSRLLCIILMHYFTGGYGHPEHDLLALRVLDSVEGCREVVALCPIDLF